MVTYALDQIYILILLNLSSFQSLYIFFFYLAWLNIISFVALIRTFVIEIKVLVIYIYILIKWIELHFKSYLN